MAADGRVEISVNLDNKEAEKKLRGLRRSIEKTAKDIESTGGKKAAITEQLEQARKEAAATAKEIGEIKAQKFENESVLSGKTGDVSLEEFEARKQAQAEITYQLQEQEKLHASQNATVADLEKKERDLTSQLEQQTAQLEQQKAEAGEVERVIASQASSAMPQLSASAEAVSKSMQKGFKNILKWGFGIRSAFILMRRLRSAVVESVKAFAAQDEETRNNINGLKASLATLKASWGAAFAPVFNAVVPILQKLISWLTTAANAIAMFFAALTGKSTYKRAVANNNALADSYGAAGAAAKKAEGQIMGFDEINKLNADDDSGGGGAGGAAAQFEEVPIDDKFKSIVDKIKENLAAIEFIVGTSLLAVGAILAISGANIPLGLGLMAVGAISLASSLRENWGGVSANVQDAVMSITAVVGSALLAIGALLVFSGANIPLGIGLMVAGLLSYSALALNWGNITQEVQKNVSILMAILGGALLAIGAILVFSGANIPLGIGMMIAGGVSLGVATALNWDYLAEKIGTVKDKINKHIDALKQKWGEARESVAQMKTSIVEKWEGLKSESERIWNGIKEKIKGYIDKIKGLLDFQWSFPHIKMPHFSWYWQNVGGLVSIPMFSVDWYARGGIVDGATLIGAGEAGKEAIVPLERNTGWINMVADGIIDRLMSSNALADFISGRALPAVASGQIVPPNATGSVGNALSDSDISRLVSGFMASLAPMLAAVGSRQPMIATLQVNGREFCRATFYDQQDVVSEHGISLITR